MASKELTIEQVLNLLTETPPRITVVTAGLTEDQLHISPKEEEWSANDVLAHIRSCADVWGDCIAIMLAQDRPTIRAVNPTTWIKQTKYPELDFAPSLLSYTTQRADLLAVLESLPQEAWSRKATVTGAGRVLERTVHHYAAWLARHEQPHIKQIERIVNGVKRKT